MVTPCINNTEHFYYQLMHIMLKNTQLLKHSKIMLQHVSVYIENHLQGAKVSACLPYVFLCRR